MIDVIKFFPEKIREHQYPMDIRSNRLVGNPTGLDEVIDLLLRHVLEVALDRSVKPRNQEAHAFQDHQAGGPFLRD